MRLALALPFMVLALLSGSCVGSEDLCRKVCKKAFKCADNEEGSRDLSDCNDQCEAMAEETKDACTQEFRRLSKCYNRRFDCDGIHDETCERRRDQLNTCLNAQRN